MLAILPIIRSSRKKHSLLVLEDRIKLILDSPKNCLDKLLSFQLGVKDPQAYFASFKPFIRNCRYKLPYATANFTLFSIESVENGAWLNISIIKDIIYQKNEVKLLLLNGAILPVFTCRRSLIRQLRLAYQCDLIIKFNYSELIPVSDPPNLADLLNVPVNNLNKNIFCTLGEHKNWPRSWEFSQRYHDNLIKAALKKER